MAVHQHETRAHTWTVERVKERLKEAAETMRNYRHRGYTTGYASYWPPVIQNFWDAYQAETQPEPRMVPSAGDISGMDEAFGWYGYLNRTEQGFVLAWAWGAPWWRLCSQFRKSESGLRNWLDACCQRICDGLNKTR